MHSCFLSLSFLSLLSFAIFLYFRRYCFLFRISQRFFFRRSRLIAAFSSLGFLSSAKAVVRLQAFARHFFSFIRFHFLSFSHWYRAFEMTAATFSHMLFLRLFLWILTFSQLLMPDISCISLHFFEYCHTFFIFFLSFFAFAAFPLIQRAKSRYADERFRRDSARVRRVYFLLHADYAVFDGRGRFQLSIFLRRLITHYWFSITFHFSCISLFSHLCFHSSPFCQIDYAFFAITYYCIFSSFQY